MHRKLVVKYGQPTICRRFQPTSEFFIFFFFFFFFLFCILMYTGASVRQLYVFRMGNLLQYRIIPCTFKEMSKKHLSQLMRLWHFSSSVTHSSNTHEQPSNGVRCLIFGRTLRQLPYFMCANSEGSVETARMRRLA